MARWMPKTGMRMSRMPVMIVARGRTPALGGEIYGVFKREKEIFVAMIIPVMTVHKPASAAFAFQKIARIRDAEFCERKSSPVAAARRRAMKMN